MTRIGLALLVLALAGCGGGGLGGLFEGGSASSGLFGRSAPVATDTGGEVTTEVILGEAEAEDIAPETSTERAAAVAAGDTAVGDSVRGFTVATLGDATVPGVWIETPLVDRDRAATVVAPDGTTIEVTARPSGGERGSGSRLSLAAFQALRLDLTALPTVTVIAE